MKTLIYHSFLLLLFAVSRFSYGDMLNTVDTYVEGKHISGTKLVTAYLSTLVATNSRFVRRIMVSNGYDLLCDKETYTYQHVRYSSNFQNPYLTIHF